MNEKTKLRRLLYVGVAFLIVGQLSGSDLLFAVGSTIAILHLIYSI
jgi:hypothetical protein